MVLHLTGPTCNLKADSRGISCKVEKIHLTGSPQKTYGRTIRTFVRHKTKNPPSILAASNYSGSENANLCGLKRLGYIGELL